MFDHTLRTQWADTLYKGIREKYSNWLETKLPENAAVTIGFPSRRARGKAEERAGAEVSFEWTGNASEAALVSVHPEKMKDALNAAKALKAGMFKACYTPRSAKRLMRDVVKESDLREIVNSIGEPPSGYAVLAEPAKRDRARLRLWECECHPPVKARVASDNFKAKCLTCNKNFQQVSKAAC